MLEVRIRSSIEVTSSCVYVFSLTSTRFLIFVERFELRKDIPESRFKFQDPLVPWYCIVQLILRGHLGPCLAQGKLSATLYSVELATLFLHQRAWKTHHRLHRLGFEIPWIDNISRGGLLFRDCILEENFVRAGSSYESRLW